MTVRLLTVGHGTASEEQFADLLVGARVELVVDVRSAPGSRRNPQFTRRELERWLPAAGVSYRWEPDLGGFRRPRADSANLALRHPGFRGYADYMETEAFQKALQKVHDEAAERVVAVMCAESLWWRCHRRLIADAALGLFGVEVLHLGHDARLSPHRPTPGLVVLEGGRIRYGLLGRADQGSDAAPRTPTPPTAT